MRRKKHKNTRRAVKFYKLHYKFREPFKVLLDGNFVHVTCQANLSNLDEHIPKLLGAKCKLFVTPCVMHELKSLGKEYSDSRAVARAHALHKCGHEEPVSAADCLLQQVGRNNKDHWWVASQDKALKEGLEKIPGCPYLFASVNGLHLDVPSDLAKSLAKEEEEKHLGVQDHERRTAALKDLDTLRAKGGKSIFRKRKAKGPNPLAIKKKDTKVSATKPNVTQVAEGVSEKTSEEQSKGKSRKRRRHKATAVDGGGGGD